MHYQLYLSFFIAFLVIMFLYFGYQTAIKKWLAKRAQEALQLKAVQNNGYAIRLIKNPSEKLKIAAVRQNASVIQFMDDPSERVQYEAVHQEGDSLQFIKYPSFFVIGAALRQSGYAVVHAQKYLQKYEKSIQDYFYLIAVTQNGLCIRYIDDPSEKVQLAAVRQNAFALQWIANPSAKVILLALSLDKEVIRLDALYKALTAQESQAEALVPKMDVGKDLSHVVVSMENVKSVYSNH